MRRHGGSSRKGDSPEYKTWENMKARCHNPNAAGYQYYGGRGISVCAEWRGDFSAFLQHIGPRPGIEYSVDRIDNDKGYAPGNVRWATRAQQHVNKRARKDVKLVDADIAFILHWAAIGYTQIKIGRSFGVSHTMISYIVNGKQWAGRQGSGDSL